MTNHVQTLRSIELPLAPNFPASGVASGEAGVRSTGSPALSIRRPFKAHQAGAWAVLTSHPHDSEHQDV